MAVAYSASDSRLVNGTSGRAASRGSGTVMIRVYPNFSSGDGAIHGLWFHDDLGGNGELSYTKWSDNKIYVGWTDGTSNYRIVIADTGIFSSGEGWSTHIFTYDVKAGLCCLWKNTTVIGRRDGSITTVPVTQLTIGNGASGVYTGSAGSRLQDFARWRSVLPISAISDLASGACPPSIERGNLDSYVPLMDAAAEIDRVSGDAFTQTGTAMTIADGPPQWFGARSDLTHYTGTSPPPPPPSNTNYLMPMLGVGDD